MHPGLLAALGVLLIFVLLQMWARCASPPAHLGPGQKEPAPPPPTPNCVVSLQGEPRADGFNPFMEPLPRPDEDLDKSRDILIRTLARLPRCRPVTIARHYIHAEARSSWFGFVDDLEFFFPEEEPVIHFRSASRRGRSDLGVNRARMEILKAMLERETNALHQG